MLFTRQVHLFDIGNVSITAAAVEQEQYLPLGSYYVLSSSSFRLTLFLQTRAEQAHTAVVLSSRAISYSLGRFCFLLPPSHPVKPMSVIFFFSLFFLMAAQLDVLIKVDILNASRSENTEWNMRLISRFGDEFLWAAGVFFFFLNAIFKSIR